MKLSLCSTVIGLVVLTSLIACTGPMTGWTKNGASEDDLRAAQRECSKDASQYSFVDTSYLDGAAERERSRDSAATADIYRNCMEGQGWHRGRLDQKPATAK